jgi:DNA-binding MarR family transcriptional regulator
MRARATAQRGATGERGRPGASGPAAGPEVLADRLLAAMAAIRRSGRRQGGRPALLSDLRDAQLELVRLVHRRPGCSVADAAEELRLAPNTVSTLVGRLTEAGLVRREVDPADRRVAHLVLAAEARRKVDAWRDRRVAGLADAIERLPAADRRKLAAALPVLVRLADSVAGRHVPQGPDALAP